MIGEIRNHLQPVVVYGDEGTTAIISPLHINSVIEQSNGE
jgi:hypothetical protein